MRLSILDRFDFDTELRKQDSVDDEMLTPIRGEAIIIKTHCYGASDYIREKYGEIIADAKCYLIPKETVDAYDIKLGDMLNGQPIKIINEYTIPSGRARKKEKSIYEVFTYKK